PIVKHSVHFVDPQSNQLVSLLEVRGGNKEHSKHDTREVTQIKDVVLPKEESNPLAKCQSTMEVNILVMVLSSNESMDMIFIWRVNRSEMSLRPPPGGPMADTNS
ncbi:hypothetical protein pdam_00005426, partial [Pocillopora damicornis]